MTNIRTMYKDLELIKQGRFIIAPKIAVSKPIIKPISKPEVQPQPKIIIKPEPPSSLELELENLRTKIKSLEQEEKIHKNQEEQIKKLEELAKATIREKDDLIKTKVELEQKIKLAETQQSVYNKAGEENLKKKQVEIETLGNKLKEKLQFLEEEEKIHKNQEEQIKKLAEEKIQLEKEKNALGERIHSEELQEQSAKKQEEEDLKNKQSQLATLEEKMKTLEKEKLSVTTENTAKINALKSEIANLEKEAETKAKNLEMAKEQIKEDQAKLFEKEVEDLETKRLNTMMQSAEVEKQIASLREKIKLFHEELPSPKPSPATVSENKPDELEAALLKAKPAPATIKETPPIKKNQTSPTPRFVTPHPARSFDPYHEPIDDAK